MKRQMAKRDSLRQAQQLAAAKKAARDTSGVEEAPEETEIEPSKVPAKPQPKDAKKDSGNNAAVLPDDQRKSNTKRKSVA
jgi:penicillin-binding protein 2